MKLTVISLAYREEDGFDAGPLEEFCAAHSVSGWTEHFFMRGGYPELVLVLQYEESRDRRRNGGGGPGRREGDPRRELAPPARVAYDRLRQWRSLRARQDGVPVYVVFSNRELAAIAAARPESKEALRAIEGIGKGKAEKYAEDLFVVLASLAETAGDSPGETPGGARGKTQAGDPGETRGENRGETPDEARGETKGETRGETWHETPAGPTHAP